MRSNASKNTSEIVNTHEMGPYQLTIVMANQNKTKNRTLKKICKKCNQYHREQATTTCHSSLVSSG